jgi:hypothetical protein
MTKFEPKAAIFVVALLVISAIVGTVSAVNSGDERGSAVLYESKYADYNPTVNDWPVEAYGYVKFYVRGVTVRDPYIFIARPGTPFDPTYHMDGTPVVGKNKDMLMVETLSDGVSDPVLLAAGTYIAYIRNGNSDQVEMRTFKIGNGQTEHVAFLGQAFPMKRGFEIPVPEPTPEPEPEPVPGTE